MKNKLTSIFTDRAILASLILGFSSGLPLALSSSTLKAWYATTSISLVAIGFLGFAALPYNFKFLWAPFMDRFIPPFLGRRRGWILLCQMALCLVIFAMSFFSPEQNPKLLLILALFVAFLSASQDIAIDAYRVDLFKPEERPMGAAMAVNGYRVAMLISGGLVLVFADHFGWRYAYASMAIILALNMIVPFVAPEPERIGSPPKNLWDCTVVPFVDFLSRPQAIALLIFVLVYKLGDAFAGSYSQVFLIRKVQMSLSEIGTLIKISGFIGTILGTIVGGLWVPRLGWFRALFLFEILQALGNLFYIPLIWTGPNYFIAGSAIFMDNFSGGMGTAAFVGLLMGLCNPKFSAFQYALLSALSSVARVFINPFAGMVAETYGWEIFFFSSLLLAIPGLLLLLWIKNDFNWKTAEAEGST